MRHFTVLAAAAAAVLAFSAPAEARRHHHQPQHHHRQAAPVGAATMDNNGHYVGQEAEVGVEQHVRHQRRHARSADAHGNDAASAGDPRPRGLWCMWWLRRHLGIPKSAFPRGDYNIAAAGRFIGSPASGPAVGVIVVWRHHVGIITGRSGDGWVVLSGNDGGGVRERARSIRGAIAYRWPPGVASLQ